MSAATFAPTDNTDIFNPGAQNQAGQAGTPLNSDTLIAQGDNPNDSPLNVVSDASPAGIIDSNSAVPPKQLNVEVNKQIVDSNVQLNKRQLLPTLSLILSLILYRNYKPLVRLQAMHFLW
jgi:hypothetical protein